MTEQAIAEMIRKQGSMLIHKRGSVYPYLSSLAAKGSVRVDEIDPATYNGSNAVKLAPHDYCVAVWIGA